MLLDGLHLVLFETILNAAAESVLPAVTAFLSGAPFKISNIPCSSPQPLNLHPSHHCPLIAEYQYLSLTDLGAVTRCHQLPEFSSEPD